MIYLKMPDGKEYDVEHTARTAVIIYNKLSGIGKAMFKRKSVGKFIRAVWE